MEEHRQAELKKIKTQFTTTGEGANDENYNPHVYRAQPNGTTFWETTIQIIKASFGTGLLAMPSAFKHSGLVGGTIITIGAGVMCTYTIHILNRNQYIVCKRLRIPYLSYPATMKAAALVGPISLTPFANFFEFIIDFFIIIYQTGISSVYIVFVASNIKSIVDRTSRKSKSIKAYILYLFLPFCIMLLPPNLKQMAPILILANAIEFTIFFIIISHIIDELPHISTIKLFGSLNDQPLSFGTVMFATAGIGAVTTIEKTMQDPYQFATTFGTLNIAMIFIVTSYFTMGFIGFWRFGDATLGSITLNLEKEHSASLIQAMSMFSVYLTFGLNGYVPVDIIWGHIQHKFEENEKKWIFNYILRFFFVIFAFILALSVPLLELVISLLGAFCMSFLQLILPPIMDICICWPTCNFGRFHWNFIFNIFVIIIGFIGLVSGTFESMRNIVHALEVSNDTLEL